VYINSNKLYDISFYHDDQVAYVIEKCFIIDLFKVLVFAFIPLNAEQLSKLIDFHVKLLLQCPVLFGVLLGALPVVLVFGIRSMNATFLVDLVVLILVMAKQCKSVEVFTL
jgi:lysylphosphatidylglycerol synthetase-like protein (DUF2156 family)